MIRIIRTVTLLRIIVIIMNIWHQTHHNRKTHIFQEDPAGLGPWIQEDDVTFDRLEAIVADKTQQMTRIKVEAEVAETSHNIPTL